MLLELLGKGDIVEIVETVDRVPEGVVIFLFDQESVVCIVDSFNVQLCPALARGFHRRLEVTHMLHGDKV